MQDVDERALPVYRASEVGIYGFSAGHDGVTFQIAAKFQEAEANNPFGLHPDQFRDRYCPDKLLDAHPSAKALEKSACKCLYACDKHVGGFLLLEGMRLQKVQGMVSEG